MASKVISFRVPSDLYLEFERKCKDEDVQPTTKIREFVEGTCHAEGVDSQPQVKVINVGADKVDKVIVMDPKRKSWFPFDFSPLFSKDR